MDELTTMNLKLFVMLHGTIFTIRNTLLILEFILACWAGPCDEPWGPVNDIGKSFDVMGNISDEVEGSVVTSRVPIFNHNLSVFVELSQERCLD